MNKPEPKQFRPYIINEKAGEYLYCTCGKSDQDPYCDRASHKNTEWRPMKVVIDEPRTVAWCACKQSSILPFCDGTHNK